MKIRYSNEFFYKIFISIVIVMYMMESTSISNYNDNIFHDILLLSALVVALVYIIKSKYTLKELGMLLVLNSIGVLCFLSSGYTGLLITMLAITLLPEGSLDRVLRMILKEEVILFIIIISLSFIGVLNGDTFDINKGTYVANAFSLGFGHPNMLAAQGTSIVLLYLCVNRKRLQLKHYLFSTISIILIFIISRGRTALLLGMIAVMLIAVSKNRTVKKVILNILPWIYIIVLILLVGFMVDYSKLGHDASIVKFINDGIFNGRIGLAYRSLLTYPISPFGKTLDFSIWDQYQYFSLDNGQVMVLLEYGVIGFIAYFVVIQKALKKIKKGKEVVLGIVMIVFLGWSMYEGTMYFIGKNFALLFLGANSNILKIGLKRRRKNDS